MNVIKLITYLAVIIGALNWGLIGAFDFDLISFLFGDMSTASRIVYSLVGICAIGYFVFTIRDEIDCEECGC